MEIATEILKGECKYNKNKNKNNEYIHEFSRLNLKKMCQENTYEVFVHKTESSKLRETINKFVKIFFDTHIKNITDSIIFAYSISFYPDKIFNLYLSRSEEKLKLAANKIVFLLGKILETFVMDDNIFDEFYESVDHYYSLYKLYVSKDSIEKISVAYNNAEEISKVNIKKKENGVLIKGDELNNNITKMLDYDLNVAVKTVLHNYSILLNQDESKEIFWEEIRKNLRKNNENLLIILIAELRIKLIRLSQNPESRKELYYAIDIEKDFIEKIRVYSFNYDIVKNTVNILQKNLKLVDNTYHISSRINKYDEFNNKSYDALTKTFKIMFDHLIDKNT